jgi:hypothetical protein
MTWDLLLPRPLPGKNETTVTRKNNSCCAMCSDSIRVIAERPCFARARSACHAGSACRFSDLWLPRLRYGLSARLPLLRCGRQILPKASRLRLSTCARYCDAEFNRQQTEVWHGNKPAPFLTDDCVGSGEIYAGSCLARRHVLLQISAGAYVEISSAMGASCANNE